MDDPEPTVPTATAAWAPAAAWAAGSATAAGSVMGRAGAAAPEIGRFISIKEARWTSTPGNSISSESRSASSAAGREDRLCLPPRQAETRHPQHHRGVQEREALLAAMDAGRPGAGRSRAGGKGGARPRGGWLLKFVPRETEIKL